MRNRLPIPRADVLDVRPLARRYTEESLAALVFGVRQNKHLNAKVHSAIALLTYGWGRPEPGPGVVPFEQASPDEIRATAKRGMEDLAAKGYTIIGPDGNVIVGLKPYDPDAVIKDDDDNVTDTAVSKNPHVGTEETEPAQLRGSPVAPRDLPSGGAAEPEREPAPTSHAASPPETGAVSNGNAGGPTLDQSSIDRYQSLYPGRTGNGTTNGHDRPRTYDFSDLRNSRWPGANKVS